MSESGFQFSNPVLIKLSFELNKEFDPANSQPEKVSMNSRVSISSTEDNSAIVTLDIGIEPNGENYPYIISAAMSSEFRWSSEISDKKLIDSLLHKNAPALLLGYLRPYIAFITAAGPAQQVNIPFMDFTKKDAQA